MDTNFADDLRNKLMDAPGSSFIDLAAFNINRGRDHGLRSWVDYVRAIQGVTISTWDQLQSYVDQGRATISTANMSRLRALYA
jgi:hypothetical protein